MRSLRWAAGLLVDDIRGARTVALDGTTTDPRVNWAFGFDRAVGSPTGEFVALYTERGTKAVIARGQRVLRELNRSFYCADAYEYPICLFRLPDGRDVVAHCPDAYDKLHIEDVETGERLTERDDDHASDVFHSRLRASPDGRHLLSAGWVWHPYGVLDVFDVEAGLARPASLDEQHPFSRNGINAEVESACWLDEDLIVVATTPEEPLDDDSPDELGPSEVGVWSIGEARWQSRTALGSTRLGSLTAFGRRVLGLFGHPKLLDPFSGELIAEWPDIDSGRQDSSIVHHLEPPPPAFAADTAANRFAIAQGEDVVVVELPPGAPRPENGRSTLNPA